MTNKDGSETIRVLPTTKQRLIALASYGESMDDIINRLLPKEKKQQKQKEVVTDD